MKSALEPEKFGGNPVEVVSGQNALREVFAYADKLSCHRLLIVCGENVSQLPQVCALAETAPDGYKVEVFAQVEPDPSDHTVVAGGQQARSFRADLIVAIGGGSSIDAGKAIAAEAAAEGWIFSQDRTDQPTNVPDAVLPIIAVPTTAGTGSEVTPFSVITFTEMERKLALNHKALYPKFALLDPTLLTTVPAPAQAAAGMDALTHAVESYLSRKATDRSQQRALQAIELLAQHFRTAYEDPEDLKAQAGMQRAAMVAGLAFSVSRLGIVHAMALPLSALFGVPHGIANAILLPYGVEFNRPAATGLLANIAQAMGVCKDSDTAQAASERAVAAIRQLAKDVGAPQQMREVGVEEAAIERMAQDAIESAHISRNPRPVNIDDIISLYHEAY